MRLLVLLACVALAYAGGGCGPYGCGGYGGYGYGLGDYGGYGLGYGKFGYGGYGGYGYPGYFGYGYGYPSYGVAVNKGYAGVAAASAQSSASSSSRRRTKKRGEWEQTVTTRIKKIVECEWECQKSRTCRRQWSVAHSYWGSCSQCKSC